MTPLVIPHQVREGIRSIGSALASATGWRGHLLRAACLVLPFALFVFVAFGEMSAGVALEIRYKNPVIVFLLGLFFCLAYRLKGWMGVLVGLSATLAVFGLELAGLWLSADSDGDVVINGLLPWSDAGGYYRGAQLLLAGGQLDPWHGRRPWFMSLLAVLLGITQWNLQWSIAMLVAISAVASFFLARAVQTTHGAVAAATALLVLLVFYSRFIGTTMSEHLGLSLGILALAVLWQGAHQPRLGFLWCSGLWLLTCALVARAGAFFVLPALLAWGAWHSYRSISRRESMRVLAMGGGAIGAGFMLDALLRRTLTPGVIPFGNFSHTLYGLIAGNKGWLQARHDHPEITGLGDAEAAQRVYELAFEALRDNPVSIVSGALGAWRDFFSFGGHGLFGFIPAPGLQLAAMILGALGLASCLWHRRTAPYAMILSMLAGVFLSVPFVPPRDAYSMRIYAATIPLAAFLVAMGIAIFLARPVLVEQPFTRGFQRISNFYGVFLVLAIFAGAIGIRLLRPPVTFEPDPCPAGQVHLYVRMAEGSSIRLVEDGARARSHVPEVRFSDFKNGLQTYRNWYPALYSELETLQPGQEIRFAVNLARDRHGEPVWLISEAQLTPRAGMVRVCAELAASKAARFYRAREIRPVKQPDG